MRKTVLDIQIKETGRRKRAWETTSRCTEDLNVSKNVTLTTGRAISGQATPCEKKVVTKTQIPITHSLKGNLLCSLNMRS